MVRSILAAGTCRRPSVLQEEKKKQWKKMRTERPKKRLPWSSTKGILQERRAEYNNKHYKKDCHGTKNNKEGGRRRESHPYDWRGQPFIWVVSQKKESKEPRVVLSKIPGFA